MEYLVTIEPKDAKFQTNQENNILDSAQKAMINLCIGISMLKLPLYKTM